MVRMAEEEVRYSPYVFIKTEFCLNFILQHTSASVKAILVFLKRIFCSAGQNTGFSSPQQDFRVRSLSLSPLFSFRLRRLADPGTQHKSGVAAGP